MRGLRTVIRYLICFAIMIGGVSLLLIFGLHWLPLDDRDEDPAILQTDIDGCYVYGENAFIRLKYFDWQRLSLISVEDTAAYHFLPPTDNCDGIYWPDLAEGVYRVYADDIRIRAAADYAQEGYTLTRHGQNRHWRLYADQGFLWLRLTTTEQLPDEVYDIIIDAGHGGVDSGAESSLLTEKDENLWAALYMKQCFEQLGLKVALTRDGDYSIGQQASMVGEIDPYIPQGRVELVYACSAKYLLSNHLNASSAHNSSGYQVYCSVTAAKTWAEQTAAAWRDCGVAANNESPGACGQGIYQRYADDDATCGRDYYYILRETGGLLVSPEKYLAADPRREKELYVGAEALLLEYVFLDYQDDADFWQENRCQLVEAVVAAAAQYWNL